MCGRGTASGPPGPCTAKPGRATTFRAMFRDRPVSDRARREPGRPVPPTRGRVTRPSQGKNTDGMARRGRSLPEHAHALLRMGLRGLLLPVPVEGRERNTMISHGNSFSSGKTTERQAPLWAWLLGAAPR